jgi:predicted negative regulator of RcsB-dependent stress response
MDIYASDEEKGEAIKQWWRDNGRNVVLLITLVAAASIGGRYWLSSQQLAKETASYNYHQVLSAISQDEAEKADSLTQVLVSDYAKTPYSVFAAIDMASQAQKANDLATAKTYYQWVIQNASSVAHQELAHLRLASLFYSENDYESALQQIDLIHSLAYVSLRDELKGDIFVEQGKNDLARAAYQQAIISLSVNEPRQVSIQMKLDNIAQSKQG